MPLPQAVEAVLSRVPTPPSGPARCPHSSGLPSTAVSVNSTHLRPRLHTEGTQAMTPGTPCQPPLPRAQIAPARYVWHAFELPHWNRPNHAPHPDIPSDRRPGGNTPRPPCFPPPIPLYGTGWGSSRLGGAPSGIAPERARRTRRSVEEALLDSHRPMPCINQREAAGGRSWLHGSIAAWHGCSWPGNASGTFEG
jgi:hypothetical protein